MASLLHMALLSLMLLSASTLATPAPLDAEPDTWQSGDDGAKATTGQSESQGGTESDEPGTTTEHLPTSEQSSPSEEECRGALTKWSPWTQKANNIKDYNCGIRRRTREIRDAALALTCYGEDVELTEIVESCTPLSKEEAVSAFQYYVIDRVFGWSNTQLSPEMYRPRHLVNMPGCNPNKDYLPVDLLIMLDKSGSMTQASYRLLRSAMSSLISRGIPSVTENSTRVALMTFANRPHLDMNFTACVTKTCYRRRLRDIRNSTTGGTTRIARALQEASVTFTREKGSRECSRKVILLVTDGTSPDEITPAHIPATTLKQDKNVEIFVVGISKLVNEYQLKEIASEPLMTHLFYMPTIRMVKQICKGLKTATVPE